MADEKLTGPEVLALWQKAGQHTVMLPTGLWAKVRIPNAELLIRTGRVPDQLRAIAIRFATQGISAAGVAPTEAQDFLNFVYVLVADSLLALAPAGSDPDDEAAFTRVRVTFSELREMEIPQEDLAAIVRIANRSETPESVTVTSMIGRGMHDSAKAMRMTKAEAAKPATIADYAGFRGKRSSDPRGADGAEVRAAAVGDDGDRGSADRVRTRRSRRA